MQEKTTETPLEQPVPTNSVNQGGGKPDKSIQPITSSSPRKYLFLGLFLLFVSLTIGVYLYNFIFNNGSLIPPIINKPSDSEVKIEAFSSEQEFKDYLTQSESDSSYGSFGVSERSVAMDGGVVTNGAIGQMEGVAPLGKAPQALLDYDGSRVSETNVQVKGIDEPDIIKTDGKNIFFSSRFIADFPILREPVIMLEEKVGVQSSRPANQTKIINAFPPADLKEVAGIDKQGELLLDNDVLAVFSGNQVFGYDVSDPKSPNREWTLELGSKNQIVSSRLYNNRLYIIAKTRINTSRPCPVPLTEGMQPISVACNEIYHPVMPISTDSTFTVFSINPKNGEIDDKISFVGNSGSSLVYVSNNAIYVTYVFNDSIIDFFYNFFIEEGKDLIPQEIIDRLSKLKDYEISQQAKMTEFGQIFEEYQASLDDDERLRVENEMQNRMERYVKNHLRELQKTGIVKINIDDLAVRTSSSVPGTLLNQFSLDEYEGNLRVATTVNGGFLGSVSESVNDVYVLDDNLKIIGQVQDMGLSERIYSARFIDDKGYIVTFRQTDPFYVLDLSDPKNPQLKGELKIPGYSSYLHPITSDQILGIGKEESKVKMSLFDVKSASDPKEADKYILDEYWSDVLNTHHAFLLDTKHKVFFLPGSKGGYVFSYDNNVIKLKRAVGDIRARRAIYINDYMYIVGDDKMLVLNENDWEEVNRLVF